MAKNSKVEQRKKVEEASKETPPNATAPAPGLLLIPGWKCYLLLLIAACWSPVSQLTLSPTHGSIPAARYHSQLTIDILLAAVPMDFIFSMILPTHDKALLLPALAASIPPMQYGLTQLTYHYGLGPAGSAFVVELLTYALLVSYTLHITWPRFQRFIPPELSPVAKRFGAPVIASAFFYSFEGFILRRIPELIGSNIVFSRAFAPVALALGTAALLPSKYLLHAAIPLGHTLLLNPHTPTPTAEMFLDNTLGSLNYTLIDRKEGPTGYISVLQNEDVGFRVMRCDHSLLGGNWVPAVGSWPYGEDYDGPRNQLVEEPVYSVFVMLEAVRLIQAANGDAKAVGGRPDKEAKALVVGLGIGTTPSALIAHGIETHIIEIDPVVYEFAEKYFSLPSNHRVNIKDATTYIHNYKPIVDYIIHDVFTGGAEPAELFTFEFLTELKMRLQKEGVIAINYAGDLLLPPASLIARTILEVFPSCRIFREFEAPENPTHDFSNVMFFCHKGTQPFKFRDPIDKDFLGTESRRNGLVPQFEIDLKVFDLEGKTDGLPKILNKDNVDVLEPWRTTGAAGHLELMKTVIPPKVWLNW